jgi:hypothetical protein
VNELGSKCEKCVIILEKQFNIHCLEMNTEKMMATQVALADLQVIPEVFSYDKDISYLCYLEMIYHN